jgi:hypothetical protein
MTGHERLDQAFGLLRAALDHPSELGHAISQFQKVVWDSTEWRVGLSTDAVEVIKELAYDLDYYEPAPRARSEDPSYIDQARALHEIREALSRLSSV